MKKASRLLAVVVPILFAGAVSAEEIVAFPSFDEKGAATLQIKGHLYKPAAGGKSPAVVVLHGCDGLRSNAWQWAEWLAANGYVALVVDSFGPRNITSVCVQEVSGILRSRIQDGAAAALYLASQPFVDRARLAVMGFSMGGTVARRLGTEGHRALVPASAPRFRASLPFYPGGCGIPDRDITSHVVVPMLILHGASDDWTPASLCQAAVAQAQQRGEPVQIKIFPNAHHAFDEVNQPITYLPRMRSNAPDRHTGVHVGGNREARDASRVEVLGFLQRTLGPAGRR